MAESAVTVDLNGVLKSKGWHFSSEGLAQCMEICKVKGWKPTARNVEKAALDCDLRAVGAQSLSDDIIRNLEHQVEGPIVLQVQKVKNVAVPSTKQHLPSPGRRLLRLQLTDGHIHCSAVETGGAVDTLSTSTPPGTKVRLVGTVVLQNGFLLIKKTSLEVLGGNVEHLVKKWNLQKIVPDNVERSKGGATGPPPFVSFKDGGSSGRDARSLQSKPPLKSDLQANSQKERRSEREKIVHPSSDRVGSASAVKPKPDDGRGRGRGSGFSNDSRRAPTPPLKSDSQANSQKGSRSERERIVHPSSDRVGSASAVKPKPDDGRGRGRGSGFSNDSRRAPTLPESRMQHGEGKQFGFQQECRQEESSKARGRGRGRHQYSAMEGAVEVAVVGKQGRGPQLEGNPGRGGFHYCDEGGRNPPAPRKYYESRSQYSQPLKDDSSSQLPEWLGQKLKLEGMVFAADNTSGEEIHKEKQHPFAEERRMPYLEEPSNYEGRRDRRPQQRYEDFRGPHYSGEREQTHEGTRNRHKRHLYDRDRPATSRGVPDHMKKLYQQTPHEPWSELGEERQRDTKIQGDEQWRVGVQREREPRPRAKEAWVEEGNTTNTSGSRSRSGDPMLRTQQLAGSDQYSWDWVNKSVPHGAVKQSH